MSELDDLKRRIKELEILLSVVSRHCSAMMELLTPEQIATTVKSVSDKGTE